MTSLKSTNRRVGSLFAVAALVLATITPGLVPAFASAAQITERSVELSSSSLKAQNVSYKVTFKPVSAAGAVVFNFCSNTPLVGAACDLPTGFTAATAAATGFTVAQTTEGVANAIVATGSILAESTTITLTGITNPDAAAPLYLRIVTYDTETNALAYTATALGSGVKDQGSAAASITDTVGVSAAVLESMTFCVSADAITAVNCGNATTPVLKLGEPVGTVRALSSTKISEGSLFSQISTNAASGAVVNLKSATDCGGLKRAEATGCDIQAAGNAAFTAGQPKFGVRVATSADPTVGAVAGSSGGNYQIFGTTQATPWYSATDLKLNYDNTKAVGITSPYGDSLLDTAGAPVNNKNVELIFGASAANNTPAGNYATDLSLIATGKF